VSDPAGGSLLARLRRGGGRLWVRLLLVNGVVVLVPVAGLEFARIYERQLLSALERDMNDQAALTRAVIEDDLRRDVDLGDPRHTAILRQAAKRTRTRVRLLDALGVVVADSHGQGPPEGREPAPPRLFRSHGAVGYSAPDDETWRDAALDDADGSSWPPVGERREVKAALSGDSAAQTRIARRPKAVFLFSALPV
jgi:two-component system sensor histidine kinase ChvG